MNTMLAGKCSHFLRIGHRCCQRFFYHYMNTPRGAGLNHRKMLKGSAKRTNSLWFNFIQHRSKISIKEGSIEFEALHHLFCQ